ncbi:hypothetical protein AAFN60_18995 [Roseibacillus persicicus]|uniref:hypothetical protein n=1 Tax=Roseibacillus persicicus TaxID=454148 RepID=UPI00398A5C01
MIAWLRTRLRFWNQEEVKKTFYPNLAVALSAVILTSILAKRTISNHQSDSSSDGRSVEREVPSLAEESPTPSVVPEIIPIPEPKTVTEALEPEEATLPHVSPVEETPPEIDSSKKAAPTVTSIFISPIEISNDRTLQKFAESANLEVFNYVSGLSSVLINTDAETAPLEMVLKLQLDQPMGESFYKKTVDPEMILSITVKKGFIVVFNEKYCAKGEREYATSSNGGVSELVARKLGDEVISKLKKDKKFRNEIEKLFN